MPRLLVILELVCLGLLVAGVALVYVPAALIVAGACGIWACEKADAAMWREKAAQ